MKPDSAEELDSLAGEYVLGTLSPEQYAATAERLRTDPALRAAVDAWEARLLELTALSTPQPPSPRLWRRIQRSLDELPAPRTQARWWQRLGLWQGLSAAGLAASLLLAFTLLTTPPPYHGIPGGTGGAEQPGPRLGGAGQRQPHDRTAAAG